MEPAPDFESKSAGKSPQLNEGVVRAGCGFFAAPFAAGIVGAATGLAAFSDLSFSSGTFSSGIFGLVYGFAMGVLLAWAHVILLGIPAHLLLRWLRITSLRTYLALGGVLGLALPFILRINGEEGLGGAAFFGFAAAMSAAGCAAGTLFWFIARPNQYGRPPQD